MARPRKNLFYESPKRIQLLSGQEWLETYDSFSYRIILLIHFEKRTSGLKLRDRIPKDTRLHCPDYRISLSTAKSNRSMLSRYLCHTTPVYRVFGKKRLTHILQHWITADLRLHRSEIVCQDFSIGYRPAVSVIHPNSLLIY